MKKMLLAALAAILLYGGFYVYAEFNGYPWKHSRIQKDAVSYMKEKYDMEAKSAGSSFNFKFDNYTAKVYDLRGSKETVIRVERVRFYDEDGRARGERLKDNYSEVYWGLRTEERLREAFPAIFGYEGASARVQTVYSTTPSDEGVSSERDAGGVYVPAEPELPGTWRIDLDADDFPEPFLAELLDAIRSMRESGLKADLFATAGSGREGSDRLEGTFKVLNLEYEAFHNIDRLEDLRAAISEY